MRALQGMSLVHLHKIVLCIIGVIACTTPKATRYLLCITSLTAVCVLRLGSQRSFVAISALRKIILVTIPEQHS